MTYCFLKLEWLEGCLLSRETQWTLCLFGSCFCSSFDLFSFLLGLFCFVFPNQETNPQSTGKRNKQKCNINPENNLSVSAIVLTKSVPGGLKMPIFAETTVKMVVSGQ